MRGSPIRTSSDQRSVGSSPRLIAASYVLHRLLVPRHPPCALNNLTTQQHPHPPTPAADKPPEPCVSAGVHNSYKMLASTVQFSNNDQASSDHASHQTHGPPRRYDRHRSPESRTPAPTPPGQRPARDGPFPQDPTACLPPATPPTPTL